MCEISMIEDSSYKINESINIRNDVSQNNYDIDEEFRKAALKHDNILDETDIVHEYYN